MEGSPLGVRKGAWTAEEDILLKQCIEKYGEGKWHQVPSRAGLNRCRKSCRLRWLNYLKPSIKRGHFADDEVDLIIRLHKLLGNRWSLIAGRLPGRTANDVKNYWNTHLVKKVNLSANKGFKPNAHQNPSKPNINVIKPRPRTISMNTFLLTNLDRNNHDHSYDNNNPATATPVLSKSPNLLLADSYRDDNSHCVQTDYEEMLWLENLIVKDNEVDEQQQGLFNNCNLSGLGERAINKEMGESSSIDFENNGFGGFGELFCDVELWNVFNPEPEDLCLNY